MGDVPETPGSVHWTMPPSTVIMTPWTPFVQSRLSFDDRSPIVATPMQVVAPVQLPPVPPAIPPPSPPQVSINASTTDDMLRSALSVARADLNNAAFQIDHLRKFVGDLESENARLVSVNNTMQEQSSRMAGAANSAQTDSRLVVELRQARAEAARWEQTAKNAETTSRLEKIRLDAQRVGQERELVRVRQELEEINVLYKGKQRVFEQLQSLHEAQCARDGHSKRDDQNKIDTLTGLVTKLRNGLQQVHRCHLDERQKTLDLSARLVTSENQMVEINGQLDKAKTELKAARDEIDELIGQLSEIGAKCKQPGGYQVQAFGGGSDVAINVIATPSSAAIKPSPVAIPSVPQSPTAAEDTPCIDTCDVATMTAEGALVEGTDERHEDDGTHVKLANLESLWKVEVGRVASLRDELNKVSEREKQTNSLCDLLQSEVETLKRMAENPPLCDTPPRHGNDDAFVDMYVEECRKLQESNSALILAHDRLNAQLASKTRECARLRGDISGQRQSPLHKPTPLNETVASLNTSMDERTTLFASPTLPIRRVIKR